jgi:hypothetical protein
MNEWTNELALLVRVKGLLSAEAANTALGAEVESIRRAFEQYRAKGWLPSEKSCPIGRGVHRRSRSRRGRGNWSGSCRIKRTVESS